MSRRRGRGTSLLAFLLALATCVPQCRWCSVLAFLVPRSSAPKLSPRRGAAGQGQRGHQALTARNAEDFSSLTVVQLKEKLREAGLPVSGKKAVLMERLEEAAASGGAEEQEEAEEEGEEESEEEAPAPAPAPKKAAAKKKAAKSMAAIFEVDEGVEGFYDEDNEWYPAKVIQDLGGGKCKVAWDEDGEEYELGPGYIRKKTSEVDRDGPFLPGEAVQALCDDDDRWYGGIIQTDNGDGTFTLLWDEDGEEYTCKAEAMKKTVPRLELDELIIGQKLRGTVTNVREFGAFVDVGAVRDGLVHVSNMLPRDENAEFKKGDRVSALYREEEEWYTATVDSVNKDGSFTIIWDEDGDEPYTVKKSEMRWDGFGLSVNDVVDLWVHRIDGERLGLSQFEGGRGGSISRSRDVSAFEGFDPSEWIDGKITSIMNFGFFVEISPPGGGSPAQGLVHISRIRDGFVEDPFSEGEVGQEVSVRVEGVDTAAGRMSLSMK